MNQTKAKSIRKAVYGNNSQRQQREYYALNNSRDGKGPGTIINAPGSLRAMYRDAKKAAGSAVVT